MKFNQNQKTVSTSGERRALWLAVMVFLVAVGAARIILTYSVFSQTIDERVHIASGMQWLQERTYTYDHPPLARIAAALPLYIAGLRSTRQPLAPVTPSSTGEEGNEILYSGGAYSRNLSLARLGILPFFLIACLVVWLWTKKLFSKLAGLIAILIFTTLPPVLAHSGLATTDMAITATLAATVYTCCLWLENPSMFRGLVLGFSSALSVLSKVSALVFLPACCLVVLGLYWLGARPACKSIPNRTLIVLKSLALCCAVALLVVWAGYHFSITPLSTPGVRPHVGTDRIFGKEGALHDIAYAIVERPIPAADLILGVLFQWNHNAEGNLSYLLGENRMTGWWYYFPIVLAVKTPIASLLLFGLGFVLLVREGFAPANWQRWAPALCPIGILLLCLTSRIDLGVRYLLPIYPMLAIVAGFGAARLIELGQRSKAALCLLVALLLWQFSSSALAHPDYLAYFNEIAGGQPERILIDSDLDWGQDLNRLKDKLRELKVDSFSICYNGTADLYRHGLPSWKYLMPDVQTTGWIAVSISCLKMPVWVAGLGSVYPEGFSWLERWQPVAKVGKTIRLYFIPPAGADQENK